MSTNGEPEPALRPSLQQTESDADHPVEPDDHDDLLGERRRGSGPSPVRVAALDAEHLRNAVAARLFGAAAEPVKIGRYNVLKRLGAGGMGVVYAAYDVELDRKIAIKLLRGVDEDGAHIARLKREAQALAKLSHPNVVNVHDIGSFRGQVFVAMEFVEGLSLREWQPVDPSRAVEDILAKFIEAGHGLAAAHAAGLVHRDFKPDNVLVGDDGRVRVLDFGLARGLHEDEDAPAAMIEQSGDIFDSTESNLNAPLTRTGAILGTPAYMAPEQHLGRRADARSDQYSFCVALFEKLYGQRPFEAGGLRQLSIKVLEGRINEPANSLHSVPPWLRRVIERGMAVNPQQRWPDMNSLIAALAGPRKRRWWVLGAAAAALVAVALGTWALTRESGPSPCEGGERELVGVWDPDIREQVRQAFLDTKTPYADNAWAGTARHLDAYADDWVAMHREVCEASVVRQQESPELFGRKMVCLGQRLTELEQLTELLVVADADVVSRAVVAAGSLTRIDSCADERSLIADVDDERLDELERLLASSNGRKALGKYDEAFEIAEQAHTLAQQIGTAHGEGRALLLLGDLQSKRRKVDEAKQHLREALRRADVAGDDRTRVEALVHLMRVAYLEHDIEGGEALMADARAALDRLGEAPPLLLADFYVQCGSLALARGDNDGAGEFHRQALEIREAQLGADHAEVAISMTNISNALRAQGQHHESEQMARKALAIFESQLGVNHPYTAASHNNIGNSLIEQGRHIAWDDPVRAKPYFDEAEEHYRKAVAIREANFGPEHASVALNLHNLGEAQRSQGNYVDARKTLERSLEIKRQSMPDEHPSVVLTSTALGRVLLELGEAQAARELLEPAVARRKPDDSPDAIGESLFALARAIDLTADGSARELARARELGDRALAAYTAAGEDFRGEREQVERWLVGK